MVEKNNATCSICGKPYYLCASCKDSMNLTPWKIHCDTSEHYKIFQIVRGFSTGVYTKDEAKEKFKNIDLSDLETLRPHIKDIIKDILKEDKKVVEPIVEVKSVEEIKPVYSRKRTLKVEAEEKAEINKEPKVE